jgi:hypothetical protein
MFESMNTTSEPDSRELVTEEELFSVVGMVYSDG